MLQKKNNNNCKGGGGGVWGEGAALYVDIK